MDTEERKCDQLPRLTKDRSVDTLYWFNEKLRFWNGKKLLCEHRKGIGCKECVPVSGSEHSKSDSKICRDSVSSYNLPGCKTCLHTGCSKIPSFGLPGSKASYCKDHKTDEMVDVKHPKCCHTGCSNRSTHFLPGQKMTYCRGHKISGMVGVTHKTCLWSGCSKIPSYGLPGQKPSHCKTHKGDDMIDVVNAKCIHPGCPTRSSYGLSGQKPSHCNEHRGDDMVDVKSKSCVHHGCSTQPIFGLPGQKPSYCKEHKTDNMIDMKNKRCCHFKCSTHPTFGLPGQKPSHCKEHKTAEMVNVKCKPCGHSGCSTQPSFGVPGNPATHCIQHKVLGDIPYPKSRCIHPNCKELALYGTTRPLHCEVHQLPDEFDLVQKPCISCNLPYILDKNGHCHICDPTTIRRVVLAKQKAVKDYIDANTDLKYILYDRRIDQGECGLERPDFLYDFNIQFVVNEVDEHGHNDRNCACEQARMVNITGSLGMKSLFLRWNPDKYKPLHGREATRIERLEALKKQLEYWRVTPLPEDGMTFVVYMYFDGDNPAEWKIPIKVY
jgi:hypothetical protein